MEDDNKDDVVEELNNGEKDKLEDKPTTWHRITGHLYKNRKALCVVGGMIITGFALWAHSRQDQQDDGSMPVYDLGDLAGAEKTGGETTSVVPPFLRQLPEGQSRSFVKDQEMRGMGLGYLPSNVTLVAKHTRTRTY